MNVKFAVLSCYGRIVEMDGSWGGADYLYMDDDGVGGAGSISWSFRIDANSALQAIASPEKPKSQSRRRRRRRFLAMILPKEPSSFVIVRNPAFAKSAGWGVVCSMPRRFRARISGTAKDCSWPAVVTNAIRIPALNHRVSQS